MGFAILLSIRPPSDRVHTCWILSVSWTFSFLYSQRPPECGALYKLLADLSVFALQEGFSPLMGLSILLSIRLLSDTVHT
jgi:hypothetical protein